MDPLAVLLEREDDSQRDGDIRGKLFRIKIPAEPERPVGRDFEVPAAEHAGRAPFGIPFEQRDVERVGEHAVMVFLTEFGESGAVDFDELLFLGPFPVADPVRGGDGVKTHIVILFEIVFVKFRRRPRQRQGEQQHQDIFFHHSGSLSDYIHIGSLSAQPSG
ncbi:hypothetical protein SDC9_201630 [bioreactor metagenome]|uniref:Uncharacterized protein n=1 Tax=bioreactor metagenome TaxID=1076179 RepID=A0A645IRG5_9ZZZZ